MPMANEEQPVQNVIDGPAWDVPAINVNFAHATFNPIGVRIAYGESPDAGPDHVRWRSAVFVPMNIFSSYVELMNQTLAQIQRMGLAPNSQNN